MPEQSEYSKQLTQAFQKAEELLSGADPDEAIRQYMAEFPLTHPLKYSSNGKTMPLGKTVAEGLKTIVQNLSQNKYLYSILMTALVEKIVHPKQDIRYSQSDLQGGFSLDFW
jgi:hypothetical protein